MIKPKYKKGLDISQLARSVVEYATGDPLTPRKPPVNKPFRTKKKPRAK